MITGTFSSCKMDSRIGYRVILRKTKTQQATPSCLRRFLLPKEIVKACQDLKWTHDASTLHRSETIGIAERAVRRVKEGTAIVMVHSGVLDHCWVLCDGMRNVHDKMADGKAAYDITCGVTFGGPEIPLGPNVSCKPILSKDEARPHQSWQNDASQNLHGIMHRVRVEDGQAICCAHRGLRAPGGAASLRHPRQTVRAPGSRRFHVRRISQNFQGKPLSKMAKTKRILFAKKNTLNTVGA